RVIQRRHANNCRRQGGGMAEKVVQHLSLRNTFGITDALLQRPSLHHDRADYPRVDPAVISKPASRSERAVWSTACSSCMASAISRTPYGSRPEPKSRDGHEPQPSRTLSMIL